MARKKDKKPNVTEEDRKLFLDALNRLDLSLEELVEQVESSEDEDFETLLNSIPVIDKDAIYGTRKTTPTTKKRPKNSFDAHIDLHGMILEAALKELDQFLYRAQKKGFQRVLVIHGKGSGVLKNGVRAHLQGHESVSKWRIAPPRLGQDGAVIVELRRNK